MASTIRSGGAAYPRSHDREPRMTTDFLRPVILASRSPRRRELLRQHGIGHDAVETGVDDGILERGCASPAGWVASLAYLKAAAGLVVAPAGSLVIGADTVCVLDDTLIGQPRDADHAGAMLRAFVERDHDVLTGVALVWREAGGIRREFLVDRATVRVGALSDAALAGYVASDLWRGKAGAYNLSERLAAGWPIEFGGDPGTIMGLPMTRLMPMLRRFGVTPSDASGPYDSLS
ncbi:MAG: Maf family protein [Phycisphaerales bacterium]